MKSSPQRHRGTERGPGKSDLDFCLISVPLCLCGSSCLLIPAVAEGHEGLVVGAGSRAGVLVEGGVDRVDDAIGGAGAFGEGLVEAASAEHLALVVEGLGDAVGVEDHGVHGAELDAL